MSPVYEMRGCTFSPVIQSRRKTLSCDFGNISQSSIEMVSESKKRKD